MKKILIVQTRVGMGDFCIFLSSIHAIAKKYSNYEIFVLTKERTNAKILLKYDPYIKNITYIQRDKKGLDHDGFFGFFKLKEKLNFIKPEICFVMHSSLRYWLLCKFLGASKIYSYEFFKKNENITNKIYQETKKWLELNTFERSSRIFWKDIKISNLIGIGIGSSGVDKKWLSEYFVKLVHHLYEQKKDDFCFFGGKNDIEFFEEIKKKLNPNIQLQSTCHMGMEDSLNLLKACKLYIGSDSGFMHLSGALGIKSFGLFGNSPTNYVDYSKFITPIIPEGYQSITHNSNAMDKITPDHVFNTVKNFI